MRRQSREIALQILFQIEFSSQISYQDFLQIYEESTSKEVLEYSDFLINGVKNNKDKLDQMIQAYSQHWSLNRMSHIDRNIIRIAVFELKLSPEKIQPNIIINEAIEIAKKFGSSDSSSFINGILDAISKGL